MAEGSNAKSPGGHGHSNATSGGQGAKPQSDPRLPLTAMQVFKLKKNWKGVKRRLEDTGVEMLIRLFRLAPAIQGQFKSVRHLESEDKLRMSEELEEHAGKMMTSLDEIVNGIDDVDFALNKISAVGKQHKTFEGFEPQHFMLIEQPFLDAVRIILEDRYTSNMDTIYRILIKFILEHLVKAVS